MTTPNNATPSINAAKMIALAGAQLVQILPEDSHFALGRAQNSGEEP